MSIIAPRKKPKRITQRTLDEKIFGKEPHFDEITNASSTRKIKLVIALQFFNNEYDKKKHETWVINWIKNNAGKFIDPKYADKDAVSSIRSSFQKRFISSIYGLMRSIENGLIPTEQEIKHIEDHLDFVINSNDDDDEVDNNQQQSAATTKKLSPIDRINNRIEECLFPAIEGQIDDFVRRSKNEPISLVSVLAEHDISIIPAVASTITDWVDAKRDFYLSIRKMTDEQLVEGYSNLNVRLTNKIARWLDSLKTELDTLLATKKAQQKAKAKANKATTAASSSSQPSKKMIANFAFKPSDTTYTLQSLNPEQIIGASAVILFHTKYRQAKVLIAPEGGALSIKGKTQITGADEALSFQKSIRKPEDVLPFLLSKTKLQIIKHLKSNIKSKELPATPVSNTETIILRVF